MLFSDFFVDLSMSLIAASTIILVWNDIIQLGEPRQTDNVDDNDLWTGHETWQSLYSHPSGKSARGFDCMKVLGNLTLIVTSSGDKLCYLDGALHRDDGPAIIKANGDKYWYQYGGKHRHDGPAVVRVNGEEEWYLHNALHRPNGPALIRDYDRSWYYDGKLHRLYEPAYIHSNGYTLWYRHGKLHREDGSAKNHLWYINGDILLPHEITWHTARRIRGITMALTPLELSQYVILWILEFSEKDYLYDQYSQKQLIAMIERVQLSCRDILEKKAH